jgi:hypothetical protein
MNIAALSYSKLPTRGIKALNCTILKTRSPTDLLKRPIKMEVMLAYDSLSSNENNPDTSSDACMHACQLVIWYTAYTQQSVHCVITLYMFKFTRFSSDMHVVTHMLSVP